MKTWVAVAPANIALIKYMGKSDFANNEASSPSLSLTLNHLTSKVVLSLSSQHKDCWSPLNSENWTSPKISIKGQERFLIHFQSLKKYFGLTEFYEISSGNNFPGDCGVASSASSFAALTQATYNLAMEKGVKNNDLSNVQLAHLSRKASGSSCRSFFTPWSVWDGEEIKAIESEYTGIRHFVVIVDAVKKEVSSSDAHRRVMTSQLYGGRVQRARQRYKEVLQLLKIQNHKNWRNLYELCWQEFWDMHALFETSSPPFGYMTGKTVNVLRIGQKIWSHHNDGPVITMDAGPNVHFLFREDQLELLTSLESELKSFYTVLRGSGEL